MLDAEEKKLIEQELAFLEQLKRERCQPTCLFLSIINEEVREVKRALKGQPKR